MPSAASLVSTTKSSASFSTIKAKASIAPRYCATASWLSADAVFSSSIGGTLKISISAAIPKPKNAFAAACALAKLPRTVTASLSPLLAIATATVVNGEA